MNSAHIRRFLMLGIVISGTIVWGMEESKVVECNPDSMKHYSVEYFQKYHQIVRETTAILKKSEKGLSNFKECYFKWYQGSPLAAQEWWQKWEESVEKKKVNFVAAELDEKPYGFVLFSNPVKRMLKKIQMLLCFM